MPTSKIQLEKEIECLFPHIHKKDTAVPASQAYVRLDLAWNNYNYADGPVILCACTVFPDIDAAAFINFEPCRDAAFI